MRSAVWLLAVAGLVSTSSAGVTSLQPAGEDLVLLEEVAAHTPPHLDRNLLRLGARPQTLPHSTETHCDLMGHTQRVQVPGCAPIELTVNACYGSCGSLAHPSSWQTLSMNPRHVLTSVGQCCNIMETKNVNLRMVCVDGIRHFTMKSAKSCACFHCKKT